jgi:N-acetylmuramoyl-L-alanine amidase
MIFCMDSVRYGARISRAIPCLIFLALFSRESVSASRPWDAEGAALAFTTARQRRSEISQAKHPTLNQYIECARAYRKVYLTDPHYRRAADAIYEEGLIYEEMGDRFSDLEYYKMAAKRFQFLVEDYGGSPNCPDALLRMSVIYSSHLNDETAAHKAYQLLKTEYKYSKAALQLDRAGGAFKPVPAQTIAAEGPVVEAQPAAIASVQSIRYYSTNDYTRVIIDLDREARYDRGRLSDPDRIFFDILHAKLSKDLMNRTVVVGDEDLKQVRAALNREGVIRVVLDMAAPCDYSVSELRNPFRLVIDLRRPLDSKKNGSAGALSLRSENAGKAKRILSSRPGGITEKRDENSRGDFRAKPLQTIGPNVAATPQAASPTSHGKRTLTRMLGLKIGRIVIDPGHGGYDQGTMGPGGLLEKDLVLSLARDLQKMLREKLGAEVILTRNNDTFVPLEERTEIANRHRADLFISIHANSSRRRSVSGVETYYLDFAKTESEREVAARENASTDNNVRDLEDLVKKIAQADKSAESRELASIVQKKLYSGVRRLLPSTQDRGVRSAPFVVLIGANMPSVLVEVAFISNPRDERLLKRKANQALLAKALFSGIESYMMTLGTDEVRDRASQNK